MYIPSGKYSNFKEEILEYPTMTKRLYRKLETKVREYMMNSNRTKKMKAQPMGWSIYYGISKGSPVSADHLRAICLYCDYTELSSIFSKSFRKIEAEEHLEAVKERNVPFWWMSKRLRETVEIFGIDGSGEGRIRGPFYSGVCFVALVSSFYISLKAPTSMTMLLEIALRFSGEHGIILKLHNDRAPGKYTRILDTQWISSYREEAERLVIAGNEPLELLSIQIINTAHDFEYVIWPLHWFDFFLSENWVGHLLKKRRADPERVKWWNRKDVKVILDLMEYADTNNANNTRFPQYVLDVFDHWRFNKKRVAIAPWKFDQPEAEIPSDLLNVIFHSLSDGATPNDVNFNVNLLTQRVLNIFPELEFIEISDNSNYRFSLPLFIDMLRGLRSVKMGTLRECKVKALWIPLDFNLHLDYGFNMRVMENLYGFKVLTIQKDVDQQNDEIEEKDCAPSSVDGFDLEIEDVD